MAQKIKELREIFKEVNKLMEEITQFGLKLATVIAILKMAIESIFN